MEHCFQTTFNRRSCPVQNKDISLLFVFILEENSEKPGEASEEGKQEDRETEGLEQCRKTQWRQQHQTGVIFLKNNVDNKLLYISYKSTTINS